METYSRTAATAMTPWWAWVRLMPSSLRLSASATTMPRLRAVEAMWPRAVSTSPFIIKILSMLVPALRASMTALRPSMMPSAGASSRSRVGRGRFSLGFGFCFKVNSDLGAKAAGRNCRTKTRRFCAG